jgi:uncharacterized cupredoxin-like copper-binding protein
MSHRVTTALTVALTAVALTACGSDTADKAADKAGKAAKSAKQKVTEAAGASGDRALSVGMRDFEFEPSTLTATAGKVTVTVHNKGQQPHEFVLLRTDARPGAIPIKNGEASEAGSVGEIGEQDPGKSGQHTFKLKAGRYVFVCNVDGHYKLGMRGALLVR